MNQDHKGHLKLRKCLSKLCPKCDGKTLLIIFTGLVGGTDLGHEINTPETRGTIKFVCGVCLYFVEFTMDMTELEIEEREEDDTAA